MPGTYHLPSHTRGDSFPSFAIAALTEDATGAPIAVSSARMQVRTSSNGRVLLSWATADGTIYISGGNTLSLAAKSAAEMAAVPVGVHLYDLEVVLTSGNRTLTLLAGNFPVLADITR